MFSLKGISPLRTSLALVASSRIPRSAVRFSSSKPTLAITDRAATQINTINRRDKTNLLLRVSVDSGGCHGFQYALKLDSQVELEDIIMERDGAKVVLDATSLDLVQGSKLDYVEELIGSSFQVVENPNADTGCGCGNSFNIKI